MSAHKPISVFLLALISGCAFCAFAAENLTITTYYPSPQGVYNKLKAKKITVGDNYYNQTWMPEAGGTINASADLVVEDRVGIGTKDPQTRVDIVNPAPDGGDPLGTNIGFRIRGGNAPDAGSVWFQYGLNAAPLLVMSDENDGSRIQFQMTGTTGGTESNPQYNTSIGLIGNSNTAGNISIMGGSVGINTNDPKAMLHVNGTMIVNGSMYSNNSNWTEVTFQNSWYNYASGFQTVQYKKIGDIVMLRGLARRSSGWPGQTTVFTLPAGYRPQNNLEFLVVLGPPVLFADGPQACARIDIRPSGLVDTVNTDRPTNGPTGAYVDTWISFDGITFSVD